MALLPCLSSGKNVLAGGVEPMDSGGGQGQVFPGSEERWEEVVTTSAARGNSSTALPAAQVLIFAIESVVLTLSPLLLTPSFILQIPVETQGICRVRSGTIPYRTHLSKVCPRDARRTVPRRW